MPITSEKNLYPGVNAHLNSFLQQEDWWDAFHTEFLVRLSREIDKHLPEDYYTILEISPQQREIPADDGEPDYMRIAIRRVIGGKIPGKPLTYIELLTSASKPEGIHYRRYMAARKEVIESGLWLVEIDFLHETSPLFADFPSYRNEDVGAYPYTIDVSRHNSAFEHGAIERHPVAVDWALPVFYIPLDAADKALLDFDEVYNDLFESHRLFRIVVDYEQDPINFDRYVPEDQAKIRALLEDIRKNTVSE